VAAALSAAAVVTACQAGGDSGGTVSADEVRLLLRQVAASAPDEVEQGKVLFVEHCSVCHGPVAEGTEQGPPLAHEIYEPSHHADAAFTLAVKIGVRSHHWRFGDMEPLPHVTDAMTGEITAYVRWLQREVGIE
jgi:mono/diheme cytochrome c family protein